MGQATRTTKLLLDLSARTQGGANTEKRAALDATAEVLTAARADLTLTFFWRMPTSSPSGSPTTVKHTWRCASASFLPMNCSPGRKPALSQLRLIPTPGPAGTSPSALQACRLPTGGRWKPTQMMLDSGGQHLSE